MGRIAKPWWRASCNAYYATVRGVQHNLGTNLKAAQARLKELLKEPAGQVVPEGSTAAVLDAFLTWAEGNLAPKTFRGYKDYCQSFIDDYGRVPMATIGPKQVTAWLNSKDTWNSTTKRGAVTCLKRAFNWAVTNDGLDRNPIAGMEKPEAKTRTQILTLQEFKAILRATPDREFRRLLRFSWETGCRPFEAKQLEPRHVDLSKSRCVIPAAEAKKKRTRVVYLPKKAKLIVERLMGNERLFLNRRGRPWTASAVKLRFVRLEEKLGRRYFQYMFRHAWITRKLKAGTDSHIVGALSGHADTKMIDRVYSHVADDHEFMLSQAERK